MDYKDSLIAAAQARADAAEARADSAERRVSFQLRCTCCVYPLLLSTSLLMLQAQESDPAGMPRSALTRTIASLEQDIAAKDARIAELAVLASGACADVTVTVILCL